MVNLPDAVRSVLNDAQACKTISTKMSDGRLHTIYMGSLSAFTSDELIFAHILMKRTQKNLLDMKQKKEMVSVLVTLNQASYEIMADVDEYQTSGPKVDQMVESLERAGVKKTMDKFGMRVLGVWTLKPKEVWYQGPTLQAGTKVA